MEHQKIPYESYLFSMVKESRFYLHAYGSLPGMKRKSAAGAGGWHPVVRIWLCQNQAGFWEDPIFHRQCERPSCVRRTFRWGAFLRGKGSCRKAFHLPRTAGPAAGRGKDGCPAWAVVPRSRGRRGGSESAPPYRIFSNCCPCPDFRDRSLS